MDAVELAHLFDLGSMPRLSDGPVARGKQGLVWRLDTADGAWAVKVPLRPTSEAEVEAAALFQQAAVDAGVPAPDIRRTTDGPVLAAVGGEQVRVFAWVDLLPPDALLDPALVGAVVGRIHALRVPAPADAELDSWFTDPVGPARWDQLVAELTAAGAPFAARLADLRDELVALEQWIAAPQERSTCHRDLWADNVLPTSAGGVCVIDWEDSGPADPSQELACVLFEFGRTDKGRARALRDAYQAADGTGTVQRPEHFSMLIAQLGHITATAAGDWLQPNPRTPERADAEAWISEVFDEPHTREVLLELLSWVSSRTS